MVEQVKRLESHLESRPFSDLGVFLNREVPVVDSRSVQRVTTGIAKGPKCHSVGRVATCDRAAEAARIEEVVGFAAEARIARIQRDYVGNHLVRVVGAGVERKGIARQRPEPGVGEAEREAGLERGNTGELPSAKDAVRKGVDDVVQAGNLID